MFVARGRRKVAHRRCAMSLPEGHEHRHIAPRWGAVPSAVCSTNIQLLTELEGMASHNVPNSRALRRDSLLILSVLSMTSSRQTPGRRANSRLKPLLFKNSSSLHETEPRPEVGSITLRIAVSFV